MIYTASVLVTALTFSAAANPFLTKGGLIKVADLYANEPVPPNVAPANLATKVGYFNQTVDHFGNQQGVNGSWFNQYYIIQDTYYKPGGPILFFVAGEEPLTDEFMTGGIGSILSWLMPKYNAMAVSLEHRFYGANADTSFPGRSVPTADISPEARKLLTFPQAIEDNAAFIKAFPTLLPQYNVTADTKWIAIGGSYPGALAAWMREKHPETVFAAHSASGPVQLQIDFWRYSYAVDQGMSFISNMYYGTGNACMKGWTQAVKIIDTTTRTLANDTAKLKDFKSKFWMSQVVDNRDFTTAMTTIMGGTVQYNPDAKKVGVTTLMELVCSGKHYTAFLNATATDADLLDAFQGLWIEQMKAYGYNGDADPKIGAAFNTAPITDVSFEGFAPQLWYYQACNQFGYGQITQPLDTGLIEEWSVYSQLNDLDYYKWVCNTSGLTSNASEAPIQALNQEFGGLNIQTSNILWVNGQYDPWHWLSNYEKAPGEGQDLLFYTNATHCNDLWGPLPVEKPETWPRVSPEYEKTFFDQVFAVYDKWMAQVSSETNANGTVNATVTWKTSATYVTKSAFNVPSGYPRNVTSSSANYSGAVTKSVFDRNSSTASLVFPNASYTGVPSPQGSKSSFYNTSASNAASSYAGGQDVKDGQSLSQSHPVGSVFPVTGTPNVYQANAGSISWSFASLLIGFFAV